MSAALSILMGHHYGSQGGSPAICVGLDGNPTACKWKARRNGDGYGIQHLHHLAALIEAAYAVDLIAAAQLQGVRDIVTDSLAIYDALALPRNEFDRGCHQVLHEIADALDLEVAS